MTESMIPMAIVPLTFLFVLLIILVAKVPKVGACVVGGLVLVAPIFLWRLGAAGAFHREEAIPLVVVPVTFLFVLMVILLAKAPKVGAALIVALVVMGVIGAVGLLTASHRTVTYDSTVEWHANQPSAPIAIAEEPVTEPLPPVLPVAPAEIMASPIWSDGVDNELEADVYPSKLAAVRALATRVDREIRDLAVEVNSPAKIVLFQGQNDPALVAELKSAIQRSMPDATCAIEVEPRNVQPAETAIAIRFADTDMQPAPWAKSPEIKATSASVKIDISGARGHMTLGKRFVEKPWMEDFATFASTRPDQHFIVTRSFGTCTSEGEAHQQALEDARNRLVDVLNESTRQHGPFVLPQPQVKITTTDILQGGFVVDQFAQSLAGSAGKIWRQAMLLEVSGSKLTRLFNQKAHEFHQMKMTWARTGASSIGVIVLIGVIYFFLNMATMGYYEWSLRVAGIVLAIVAVISILMMVQ